jgi:hypothetical protein
LAPLPDCATVDSLRLSEGKGVVNELIWRILYTIFIIIPLGTMGYLVVLHRGGE